MNMAMTNNGAPVEYSPDVVVIEGENWAIRDGLTEPLYNEATLRPYPADGIRLNDDGNFAVHELALRHLLGNFVGPMSTGDGKTFTVIDKAVAKTMAQVGEDLMLTAARLRAVLVENGAEEALVASPGAFGRSAVDSYFKNGLTTDDDKFLEDLCTGISTHVEAWNGLQPTMVEGTHDNPATYLVLTNDEADEKARAVISGRFDDELAGVSSTIADNFDRDSAITEALQPYNGGRGGAIASDGIEQFEDVAEGRFYIYAI